MSGTANSQVRGFKNRLLSKRLANLISKKGRGRDRRTVTRRHNCRTLRKLITQMMIYNQRLGARDDRRPRPAPLVNDDDEVGLTRLHSSPFWLVVDGGAFGEEVYFDEGGGEAEGG